MDRGALREAHCNQRPGREEGGEEGKGEGEEEGKRKAGPRKKAKEPAHGALVSSSRKASTAAKPLCSSRAVPFMDLPWGGGVARRGPPTAVRGGREVGGGASQRSTMRGGRERGRVRKSRTTAVHQGQRSLTRRGD